MTIVLIGSQDSIILINLICDNFELVKVIFFFAEFFELRVNIFCEYLFNLLKFYVLLSD